MDVDIKPVAFVMATLIALIFLSNLKGESERKVKIGEIKAMIAVCEKHDGLKWFNRKEIRCNDGAVIDRVASGIGQFR
jgi:hypothetical protein